MPSGKHPTASPPSFEGRLNTGAYDLPYSGVGLELRRLGDLPAETGLTIHEIGYWPNNYGWNYPSVYSPFWRLYYDFEPGHFVRFAENAAPTALGPERLIIVPDHRRFDCIGEPPIPKFWVHFSTALSIRPDAAMPIQIPLEPVTAAMINRLVVLFEHAEERPRVEPLAVALLLYLLSDPALPRQEMPSGIATLIQEINESPGRAWSNAKLANAVSMSTESFIRKFKRWTGEPPIRFVQQVRIREACRLLSATSETIDKIATTVGFADRFYFSRVFKKHTGQSPAAYRRRHRAIA